MGQGNSGKVPSRRAFLTALTYVAPAILTLQARPAFAQRGSGKPPINDAGSGGTNDAVNNGSGGSIGTGSNAGSGGNSSDGGHVGSLSNKK